MGVPTAPGWKNGAHFSPSWPTLLIHSKIRTTNPSSKRQERVMNLDTVHLENGITKVVLSGRMDIEGAAAVDLKFSVIAGAKKR
jgi:hypothetical protein